MARIFTLAADHPVIGSEQCRLCQFTFAAEDRAVLIPVKPASEEDAEKMRAGRPYTAEAMLVHATCYDALAAYVREVG